MQDSTLYVHVHVQNFFFFFYFILVFLSKLSIYNTRSTLLSVSQLCINRHVFYYIWFCHYLHCPLLFISPIYVETSNSRYISHNEMMRRSICIPRLQKTSVFSQIFTYTIHMQCYCWEIYHIIKTPIHWLKINQ